MIQQGDTVRVLAPGKFHGQVVKVLQAKERRPYRGIRGSTDYQLDTKWDDKPYPGWFGADEVEEVTQATTVQCLCSLPLLRSIEGTTTMYYVYRLATAGPDSEPVTVCPECGRVLDIGTTREEQHNGSNL